MEHLREVFQHWHLTGSAKPITGGHVNRNWQLDTGKRMYIIRQVASWKNRDDVLFEQQYLRELQQSHLKYDFPLPLIATDGSSYLEVPKDEEPILIWVYPQISGRLIPHNNMTTHNIIEIARFIGIYHSWLVKSNIPSKSHRADTLNRGVLRRELDELANLTAQRSKTQNEIANLISQVKEALNLLSDYPAPNATQYPIHRDLRPSNILWDNENRICGILDFENVSDAGDILLRDLSVALLSLGIASNKSLTDVFLAEYQLWQPLQSDYHQSLPLIHLSGIIEDVSYAIWRWMNQNKAIDVSTWSHCIELYSKRFL